MKTKLTKVLAMSLIVALALVGCGGDSTPTSTDTSSTTETTASAEESGDTTSEATSTDTTVEKTAALVSGGEPGSLHPALAQGTHESIILDHVFEGLMKRDQTGTIVPGMAASYEVSDDGLQYVFTLRDDVKWSNGDPVTAGDFEYAWKYALDPYTAAYYSYQLYYLEGGEEYNSANPDEISESELQALRDAVGVKAVDDLTLEVKLAKPTPFFLELAAFYTYYPINQAVQEATPNWAEDGATHVSNGAFTIDEWNHDQSVVVSKNENYYNSDLVNLTEITFYISEDQNTEWQMYLNDEIDVNYILPVDVQGQLRAEGNPELHTTPYLGLYYYNFNTEVVPFNNVKVRQALSMAIDREAIVEHVSQGGEIPAYGIVPPGIPDASGDFRENGGDYGMGSQEEAKALLEEGLAEEGMDSLSFTLLYNTNEGHKKMAEAIQQMWKAIGVDVELENVEFKVKLDREHEGDFEMSRAGWIGDYVDPNTFLDLWTSWSGYNDANYSNEKYDELLVLASEEFDPEVRMGYLHEAEALLMEELPIMPIYYYVDNIMIKPHLVDTVKVINRDISLIYADIVE